MTLEVSRFSGNGAAVLNTAPSTGYGSDAAPAKGARKPKTTTAKSESASSFNAEQRMLMSHEKPRRQKTTSRRRRTACGKMTSPRNVPRAAYRLKEKAAISHKH